MRKYTNRPVNYALQMIKTTTTTPEDLEDIDE